jgi:hypothetical protein
VRLDDERGDPARRALVLEQVGALLIAAAMALGRLAAFGREPALGGRGGDRLCVADALDFINEHVACPGAAPALAFLRWSAFLLLVVAALIGVALGAVPAATGTFFAWVLRRAPLGAFTGGVYVGSAGDRGRGLCPPEVAQPSAGRPRTGLCPP